MTVIVTDAGFASEGEAIEFQPHTDAAQDATHVAVASDVAPIDLKDRIGHAEYIRIDFPAFSDGRGFTIARQLRLMGYVGKLRAGGDLIADQYAMARRSGFDEVEISDDKAVRQPQEQWLFRADTWADHDYQARMRG